MPEDRYVVVAHSINAGHLVFGPFPDQGSAEAFSRVFDQAGGDVVALGIAPLIATRKLV